MKKIEVPVGVPKAELFAFLMKNKDALIQQKKMIGKEGAGVPFSPPLSCWGIGKAVLETPAKSADVLEVMAVMNTSNWLDTHLDVHIPGLWDKSLNENKMLMHLQEHDMRFEKIIADGKDLKATTDNLTWKELGYNFAGKTQALIFKSQVKKSRNPYMFDQYAQGYVKNHSVWMYYVKMVLCINEPDSTSYGAEYEAYQKYVIQIVNREFAEEMGYFWAILEAKVIEGSAVPLGSNIVTPTLSVSEKGAATGTPLTKIEPPQGTPKIYQLNLGSPKKGLTVGKLNLKH